MNILILGGSRFLGRRLALLLHEQGQNITILNRGKTPVDLPTDIARIIADRSKPSEVTSALSGLTFDTVFDISGYRPLEVLAAVNALQVQPGNYVFCSSAAVYAPNHVAPIQENADLNRGSGVDEYSRNKILCEDVLIELFSRDKFPVSIIRPPYVYGPHDYITRRLFSIFARLTRHRKIIVPGNGLALTQSIHVNDLASAFAAIPGSVKTHGEAYNAAGPEAITFLEYITAISEIMETKLQIVHVDPSDYNMILNEIGSTRSSEIFDFAWKDSSTLSNDKIYQLGWSPNYNIYNGIEMTYKWWIEEGHDSDEWDFSADDHTLSWLATHSKL